MYFLAFLTTVSLLLGTVHSEPGMPPISNTPLVFDNSKFIWTPEMVSGIAPPGERSFRKIFETPAGKAPVFAQIISICDEAHTFYVNGREVGSVPSFYNAQSICVGLEPCVNVFGIQGRNGGPGWPAAATATIRITYLDGTTTILATDSSWKSYGGVAPGFSALSFDDSSWSPAYTVGATSWTTSMGGKAPPVAGCQGVEMPNRCTCGSFCAETCPGDRTDVEPEPADVFAPPCPTPMVLSFASGNAPCGCVYSMNLAKKRQPDAVQCMPPTTNGKVGCRNLDVGSECRPECKAGYKPTPDGKDCTLCTLRQTQCVGNITRDAPALSFDDAYWIRTSLPTARPVGWRTFRRTLTSPAGKSAVLADIIISADAEFALYMNGALFGHTFPRIGQTKHFCVGLLAGTNVFAAKADYSRQTDHIGILSTMQITYTDNSTSTIVTDSSWLASTDASAGFERPDFDDRGWKNSDIVFKYPVVFGAFYNHTPEKVECQNVTLSPCPGKSDDDDCGNAKSNDVAPACPAPMVLSFASSNAPCGCVYSINLAKKRQPDAVQCMAPAKNGKAACKNLGSASKCTVNCDTGFKPSVDESSCVPCGRGSTVTMSELACDSDAGAVKLLHADPILGCICQDALDPATFCGVSLGDPESEMLCSDTTDSSGKREVACDVKCTGNFKAKDKHTCVAAS